MNNYHVKATPIKREKGWEHAQVEIFQDDVKVGEYVRNYLMGSSSTFYPFLGEDGNEYALYSKHYTCTRFMKLPSCEDIGGEEPNQFGFCPNEYYQPKVCLVNSPSGRYKFWIDRMDIEKMKNKPEILEERPAPVIFVSGMVWGLGPNWNLEAFDVRKAHEGIIKRFTPIPAADLPIDHNSLSELIRCSMDTDDGSMIFSIITEQKIFLEKDFDVEKDEWNYI